MNMCTSLLKFPNPGYLRAVGILVPIFLTSTDSGGEENLFFKRFLLKNVLYSFGRFNIYYPVVTPNVNQLKYIIHNIRITSCKCM